MIPLEIFKKRRELLLAGMGNGIVLLPSNNRVPRNFAGNPYPFRADSSFLYFTGLNLPDLYLFLDRDEGLIALVGEEPSTDDKIWSGDLPSIGALAEGCGINEVLSLSDLRIRLTRARQLKRSIHLLPQYSGETILALCEILGINPGEINSLISEELIRVVCALRSIKDSYELEEIRTAINLAGEIHRFAFQKTRTGLREAQVVAGFEYLVIRAGGRGLSFQPIFTMHGEVLHNENYENTLEAGRLVVNDSGAESAAFYASDITRTFPVNGTFNSLQREIYELVLRAQREAFHRIRPGVPYLEIHLSVARVITEGLIALGLMKGDPEELIQEGVHALFFPHGLGHMLGLDVHDMEALGEDYVGYDREFSRSKQFGLSFLRLAKRLQPGFVITVEPGIYFIPLLIEKWKAEGKFKDIINYARLEEEFLKFGGVRIEDNVLVTEDGCELLSSDIPVEVSEIESLMNKH